MLDQNALRIAEVFRLHLAGLTSAEIAKQVSLDSSLVGVEQIEQDLALIQQWQSSYEDPEQVRLSIALDLDSLFKSILAELGGNWISKQSTAKAEFYKQAREVLLQKALLYGLNTQNVNVSQKSKLWTVIQELRQDATELEAKANYPTLPQPDDLPIAIPATSGLLVESDSGTGR